MSLPFTSAQFFEVFARYNEGVWPLQFLLYGVALAALALLWAWMGVVYHLGYFREANPAATLFAALFLAGAAAFAWSGVVRRQLRFECGEKQRALSMVLGHQYPATPTFGLPCPTTIFTLGALVFLKPPYPRLVFVAPLLRVLIGSQAAFRPGALER